MVLRVLLRLLDERRATRNAATKVREPKTRLAMEKDGVEVLGYFKQPRDLHKA